MIYLVAGEASGDVIGARLMTALRTLQPGLDFAGIGGSCMQQAGLSSLFPMQDLAVMGLAEILPRLPLLRRRLLQTDADLRARKPDMLVTIDSPGFTLRLLRRMAGTALRRVHYVAPQVWAWKPGRVRRFPGLWDRLLCLLPFEPAWFAGHGLAARFVGHPVLESGADRGNGARFRQNNHLDARTPLLILMPGSRLNEIPRLLPVFGQTMARLAHSMPTLRAVMPVSPVVADAVQQGTAGWHTQPILVTSTADKHDAYAAAQAALTKSGTSTLELALAGVPMAVTYRVNPLTAFLARRMIKVPHVAMVNLLAGRDIVPELLQEQCNPVTLCDVVERLLHGPDMATAQRMALKQTMASLRTAEKPSLLAAKNVLEMV